MLRTAPLEAVDAYYWHAGCGAFMEADRQIEILRRCPERLVIRMMHHLVVVVGVGPQEAGAEAKFLPSKPHLRDRKVYRLHRQHRDAEQTVGIGLAVIGEPAIVGTAGRRRQLGVMDRPGKQAEARIEEHGVDAVGIHIGDAGMRVEPARLAFLVFHGIGSNDTLSGANRADPANADPPVADLVLLDDEALLATVVLDDPRRPVTEFRVDVVVPKVERLEDVAIGIDDVIGARSSAFPPSGNSRLTQYRTAAAILERD